MEYLTNCPKCKHHGILSTVKQIIRKAQRKPQREAKCSNCRNLARITIIGEVDSVPNYALSANPEYATHNKVMIHFWD